MMLDLRGLPWNAGIGGGYAGMMPKCTYAEGGDLLYYKASEYAIDYGFYGLSACIEVFVSRLLDILGIDHVQYWLADAQVIYNKREYETKLCVSKDFRLGRSTISIGSFLTKYRTLSSSYDALVALGYKKHLNLWSVVDYLICNWDRHGRNVELYIDTLQPAPLFDNGFSMCVNRSDGELEDGYTWSDKARVNSFYEAFLTEGLAKVTEPICVNRLLAGHRSTLFDGLRFSSVRETFMWELLTGRYTHLVQSGKLAIKEHTDGVISAF
jgi:hypothetical protein